MKTLRLPQSLAAIAALASISVGVLCGLALAQDTGNPRGGDAPKEDPKDAAEEGEKDPKPTVPDIGLGTKQGPSVGREGMWPAADAEGWAKPCLLHFERTWDDALAVAKESGRPILICINMDGEIASEHYAGVRYRQPEIATLYEPYVKVIASVYRHNPRDYDDQGNRVLCPRFGSVTCGEHIAIEPILYAKYMEGERVAPRHIMVELDGKETYDVYYANDTASVFQKIHEGAVTRPGGIPPAIVRGDRPIIERVASRAAEDRLAVEKAYKEGDQALRQALLQAAAEHPEASPVELLRLAVFGFDTELSKAARSTLAKTDAPAAIDVIVAALGVPMEQAEKDDLIGALERIGKDSRRAKWLGVVHRGLSGSNKDAPVDANAWAKALGEYEASAPKSYDRVELHNRRDDTAAATKSRPADATARVELAVATLDLALKGDRENPENSKTERAFKRLMLHDARAAALEAERLGSTDWRVSAVLALAAYYGGDREEAYRRAEPAVKAMPAGETSWNAYTVLTIFGEGRFKAIKKAVTEKEDWKPEWLADLHAAYLVLLKHPLGTDAQVLWHYDFLTWLRAHDRAARYLSESIKRFPKSPKLHNRLRLSVLRRKGIRGLEQAYESLLAQSDVPREVEWYAGFASTVAADFYRRRGKRDVAMETYARSIAHYDKYVETGAEDRKSADHEASLVHGSRSRVAYELSDDALALTEILASFTRSPGSAGTRDGAGFTPAETAQMLMARLKEKGTPEQVAQLQTAMDALDQDLLAPDRP